jgi:DNA-binding IclR family transcriptional regulator
MKRVQGTLERYVRILETLAPRPAGLALNEIIAATQLPRGTVHRLVTSLSKVGFLTARPGRSKIYVLGGRLQRLLYTGLSVDLVIALARPLLEDLSNQLGETVLLARLNGGRVEKVAAWMPGHGRDSYIQPSRIMPIHAAATAKAIFAFQSKEIIEDALAEARLVRYTPNTKTSKAAVRKMLLQVKQDGYAVCSDEFDPGVLSYACPVHLADFGTLYSIAVVGLSSRLGQKPMARTVQSLREKCDALSLALYSHVKGTQPPQSGTPKTNGSKRKSVRRRKSDTAAAIN